MGLVLLSLLAVLIVVVGGMWMFQRQLIYLTGGPPPPVSAVLPGASEWTVRTADGLALAAWFVPADEPRPDGVEHPEDSSVLPPPTTTQECL